MSRFSRTVRGSIAWRRRSACASRPAVTTEPDIPSTANVSSNMNGTHQVSASQLQLVLLGDLCLAGEVEEYLSQRPAADVWSDLSCWLPDTAVVVANLECALSR